MTSRDQRIANLKRFRNTITFSPLLIKRALLKKPSFVERPQRRKIKFECKGCKGETTENCFTCNVLHVFSLFQSPKCCLAFSPPSCHVYVSLHFHFRIPSVLHFRQSDSACTQHVAYSSVNTSI